MEDKLKMFKIYLRSVLTGMKDGASLRQLHTEYETRMGGVIPFLEFGFKNALELIRNIPDVAYIDNSAGELRVYAVTDESSAHIARMVSKQKVGTVRVKCKNAETTTL